MRVGEYNRGNTIGVSQQILTELRLAVGKEKGASLFGVFWTACGDSLRR